MIAPLHISLLPFQMLTVLLTVGVLTEPRAGATQVWSGPTITFTEASGADGTQPADQDRITPNVWLTRALNGGLFNAAVERSYANFLSPSNTAWAYGQLTNYASLTYTDWKHWNGSNPPSMVGKDAVMHIISEDIYLYVRFTAWGGSSGGFSYVRSTPPPPVFQAITKTGDEISFTWSATIGQVYRLQYKTNLISTNWISLDTAIIATNGTVTALDTNTISASRQRFYRVTSP